jgi:hypothetical protein
VTGSDGHDESLVKALHWLLCPAIGSGKVSERS